MKSIQQNRFFFILYFTILTIALIWIQNHSRFQSFEQINSFRSPLFDKIFPIITLGGTYFFSFLLFMTSIPRHLRLKWLFYILVGLMIGLFIAVLKVYFEYPRPRSFPALAAYIHNYPFVAQLKMNSYPSGHTSTVFYSVTSYLLMNPRKKAIQLALLAFGILVAYTRIYLGQHFLEDTVSGSYLGIALPTILYSLYYRKLDEIYA